MSHTYAVRRRAEARPGTPVPQAKGPSLQALQAGAAPTQGQLGSKIDLPGAIREKMENSFGADLSAVQLYESQTVADAGAQAMAMGNRIAFAPGQLDLASTAGQALLGHELSHVVSQARGEVSGSGFLSDHALEARADREGALAAAGESVYTGPVTPLSASSAAGAAGPMQAKKYSEKVAEAASWAGRDMSTDDVSAQERAVMHKRIAGMMKTPKDREKFATEIMSQRLDASKQLTQYREDLTEDFEENYATMHAAYSPHAARLLNLQELIRKGSEVIPDEDYDDFFGHITRIANDTARNRPQDHAAMQEAGGILTMDSHAAAARSGDPEDFEQEENRRRDVMQNRRANGYRPKHHWWSRG